MKRIFLISVLVMLLLPVFAQQPWMNNLPQDKVSNGTVTFFEMQKAFYEYWEPFKVNKGRYVNSQGVEVKAPGWKQFKRWEWYWETRVNAQTGEFPTTSAWEEMQKFQADNPGSVKSVSGNWTSVGPTASPGGYAGLGRLNCVGFHPTDNNTIYAGSASGGLWKTTNGGTTWSVLNDNLAVLGVSDICISTADPNTIYIATGDKDGGSVWSLGGGQYNDNNSIGVMKSTDGGTTWNTTGLSFSVSSKRSVFRLLMDPVDNTVLYAATSVGFFKTTNAGLSWNNLYSSQIFCDLEFKPGTSSTIYGSNKNGDIYRSVDGGLNWTSRLLTTFRRVEMAVSPANANYVYAVMQDNSNPLDESPVYKSIDGGETFTRVFTSTTVSLLGYDCDGSDVINSQASYDLTISADPTNANNVFVGGINVWKSTDGGSTWNINTHWSSTCSGTATTVHADQHYLAYQPVTNHLFLGNDGGLYKTTNTGASWLFIGNGIVNSQLYRIGVSQTVASEVIAGLQDNGTKLFSGGIWDDVKGGDGMECIIDYTNANIQYGTYVEGQIDRTSNHWASSTEIQPLSAGSGYWVTPYIIDPTNSQTLYAGYADVWKTTDSGENWTQISTMNTSYKLRSMAIAPSNTQVLYVADPSNIWKTSDGGTNWSNITGGLPVSTNDITYISVKADDPLTVWVTFGEYNASKVYQSVNGGTSWTNISTGLPSIPVMCVIQNKQVTSRVDLYAATDVGVFVKEGNADWQVFSTGLPNVLTTELEIYYAANQDDSRLFVATYGRGLWVSGLYSDINPVANLTAIPSSEIQVDLAWTKNSSNNPVMVAFSSTPTFGTPFNGTAYTDGQSIPGGGTVIYNGSNTVFTHTALTSATTYYYKAWSVTPAIVYSPGITANATTLCGSFALPFSQSFDATSIPVCWSQLDIQGNGQVWKFGTTSTTYYIPSASFTTNYAYLNSDAFGSGNTQNVDLVSPTFDLTGYSTVNLAFKHYHRNFGAPEAATLSYSINNGSTWTQIQQWVGTTANPSSFSQTVPAVAGQSLVKFKWNYTGTYGGGWAVDDINITGTTHTWTGSASTDWNTASNWSPTTVPVTSTKVLIPTGLVNYPVISTSGSQCANLQISSGGSVTITPTGSLTVSGTLSNNNDVNGLIVKSDASGTGSLIHSTANISGTFERFMNDADFTNWKDGWHFVSSPVSAQAIAPNFVSSPVTDYDFYTWYEAGNQWVNFKNTSTAPNWLTANNSSLNFQVGKGYMAAYNAESTKQFSGILNTSDVTISGLAISGGTNSSWHLLGNPFSSAITWDASSAWNLSNIAGVAKIWSEANQSYIDITSSPSSVIPSTNGFTVQVLSGTGGLTLPASKRVHSTQAFYKAAEQNIKLIAHNIDLGNAQESNVVINPNTTEGFDLMYDGEFLAGYGPQFYSLAGDSKLSTNSLPVLPYSTGIPFVFVPGEGNYFRIEAVGLETLNTPAWLFDKKTNTDHKLSENIAYNFSAMPTDDPNRFLLHFSGVGLNELFEKDQIKAWFYEQHLFVTSQSELSQLELIDLQGRVLFSKKLYGKATHSLSFDYPSGCYMVRISDNRQSKTKKIVVY